MEKQEKIKNNNEEMFTFPLLTSEDIEVRIKQCTSRGAVAVLYKTSRVDRKLLNECLGPFNWTSDYKILEDRLFCGIGIRRSPDEDFVWKWDCGVESRADNEGNEKKGEASDAFKRACFQVGIGDELYSSPHIFLNVTTSAKTVGNKEVWHLDNADTYVVTDIQYNEKTRKIIKLTIANARTGVIVYDFALSTTGAIAQKMCNTVADIKKDDAEAEKRETVEEHVDTPKATTKGKKAAVEANPKVVAPAKETVKVLETEKPKDPEIKRVPLSEMISKVGKIAVQLHKNQKMSIYTDVVTQVAKTPNFKCNKATDDDYEIVFGIYCKLVELGYHE